MLLSDQLIIIHFLCTVDSQKIGGYHDSNSKGTCDYLMCSSVFIK